MNMDVTFNRGKYEVLKEKTYYKKLGKVVNIVGLTIESIGPDAKLSDMCLIRGEDDDSLEVMAEVVGFKE